ncbi:MAG: PQQ-binding-like beta-propeller repeat protein [Planctomycetota bacterium]|nr:PQQ-binding-like beta-propeller repeat protein [Planctomycetota bacterium]
MHQPTPRSLRFAVLTRACAFVLTVGALLPAGLAAEAFQPSQPMLLRRSRPAKAGPDGQAEAILEATGVRGGVVVHLGCGDGRLTAALHAGDAYLVHGLAADAADVDRARAHVRAKGLYGPVSVDRLAGPRLPYVDNFVNLVVAGDPAGVPTREILRVLAPGGVAYAREGDGWKKTVKPRPKAIDDWTHYLHDPSNNAVARDTVVGPPRRMQWCGSPRYGRHHDRLSSVSAVVAAGGRVFTIFDEAPRLSILTPPEWKLIARDAFNGTVLWKRDIEKWHTHLWPLKSGPAVLPRRLVAEGDTVYATLAIDGPLTALDAATGRTVRTYEGTGATEEVLLDDDTLLLVVNRHPADQWPTGYAGAGGAYNKDWWNQKPRHLLAVDADTGTTRWEHESAILPVTLAASGGRVFFHDGESVVCLDRERGKERWRSKPVARSSILRAFFAPILLVHEGVVLFAGGEKAGHQTGSWYRDADTMTALDAETGKVLWTAPHPPSGYRSAEDLFVLGDTVWAGETTSGRAEGLFTGRNLRTGKVESEFTPDVDTYWFHHRCYRGKATVNYLLTSRTGIEFIDPAKQHWDINHWVRGACLYGVMPANGLVYAPQHPCACYLESKLSGFNALAPAGDGPRVPEDLEKEDRLQRGPAYGAGISSGTSEISNPRFEISDADWPTYRHDAARSGTTPAAVPAPVKETWTAAIGGRLSSPVVAGGRVLVAEIDAHTVHALDADTGQHVWRYTAGGRVDSPPTIHGGRVLFGSTDGYVYCLRASDGVLAWRFRAAPMDQRCMHFEQLESVWPARGSVLVRESGEGGTGAEAWCVAGRTMFLDGGMRLYRLDVATGRVLSETVLDTRVPHSDKRLQDFVSWLNMPTAMPDILSSVDDLIYMRSQAFKADGTRLPLAKMPMSGNVDHGAPPATQDPDRAHLFSPSGFLDDSYWHRTYWLYGSTWVSGWCGYFLAGKTAPAGKILVFDDARVYGYGRLPKYYRWTTPLEHHLFATPKSSPIKGGEDKAEPASVVRVGKSASLNPKGAPLTVEAWVKAETGDGVVLARGGGAHGFVLYLAGGRPHFALRAGAEPFDAAGGDKVTGRWVHLAGVLTAEKTLRLYVDGKPAGSAKAGTLVIQDPQEAMEIGADENTLVGPYPDACPFAGLIDEVRIWRRALGADEIAAHASDPGKVAGAADDLAAAWSFDDGKARDVSGNGNHGKAVGVRAAAGKVGKALRFAGRSDPSAVAGPVGQWTRLVPLLPRAMVLAGRTLFIAGPPDLVDEQRAQSRLADATMQKQLADQNAALRGKKGGLLWSVSADGGQTLAERRLAAPPVFDGMAAARGRLYLATTDGKVLCFSK